MKNEVIHTKLDKLQFETSIESGKFLIIKINFIGYGGQLSMRMLGIKLAYIFDRTVIFDDRDTPYLNYYKPISCLNIKDIEVLPAVKLRLHETQEDKVVYLDFDEYWSSFKNRRYFNNWVPKELTNLPQSKEYFNGQLLLRFELFPEYIEYVDISKKRIGFSKSIIGVHIRRGDKKNESSYVPMRIYSYFLKKASKETGIKKVFITSDSDEIFSDLPQNLGLEYIYDKEERRYNNANHEFIANNPGLKRQETLTAIKILELLSDCDCIIGQINTHFTTLAYDISLVKSNLKTKIYFVNKDVNDMYINNDPNIFLSILDIFRKYMHTTLVFIVRKIRPFILMDENLYIILKNIYYRRKD